MVKKALFILIAVLLAVIIYLILTRPDTEKPAIIKHETEIKQDTRRIDSLLLRQEELRLQLKEDSLKAKSREKAFKMRVATLEQKLIEQRAQVQALIDSVPALNAFVDTQDSIIRVQSERINELSEDGEQEYTLIYEIDLPKIINAFIEENIQSKNDERILRIMKVIESEINEIPKLQDFASGHGDSEGYARACGQDVLIKRIFNKFTRIIERDEKN